MKKAIKRILEVICSGILGVIITLVVQYVVVKPQSFTFIYDGNEIMATESTYTNLINENNNLNNQISILQAQMAVLESELDSSQTELLEQQRELDQRDMNDDINEFIQQIITLWDSGEYIQTLTLLKNGFKNSDDVQFLYKTYSEKYTETILNQVDILIFEKRFDEAKQLILETEKVVHENTELKNKLLDIDENMFIKLKDMKLVTSIYISYYIGESTYVEDSVGNNYCSDDVYIIAAENGDNYGYATFYLNKQYTELDGTIAISDNSLNFGDNQLKGYLYIYAKNGDEYIRLYSSPLLSRMTSPINISLDLTDYDWLEIRFYNDENYSYNYDEKKFNSLKVFLSDFTLYNN